MTPKEAEIRSGNAQEWWQQTEAIVKVVTEALEKQIPKPKHKYMGYRCVCGEEVAKYQDYCEYCGQRLLEWEE